VVSASALTFEEDLDRALGDVREPFWVFDRGGVPTLQPGWPTELTALQDERPKAFVPACPLENLGDPSFRSLHKTRLACMSGAMANGIG
jgi:trans-AT polyketide synthase, acyltransferase and oxidoreductase domains